MKQDCVILTVRILQICNQFVQNFVSLRKGLNLFYGMDDRAMVAAKGFAEFGIGKAEFAPAQVHGHLAGQYEIRLAARAQNILRRKIETTRDKALSLIHI